MARKQKLPKHIESKFNKPQFQLGDAVSFIWLGQQKYGHVIRTKQTGWGIQYTVETNNNMRYPCGIQIAEYKTEYTTGIIKHAETKALTAEELEHRVRIAADTRSVRPILANTKGTTDTRGVDDQGSGEPNAKSNRKTKSTRAKSDSGKNDDKSSAKGVRGKTNRSRKDSANTELDSAIQKQRNFLNGFVKKD